MNAPDSNLDHSQALQQGARLEEFVIERVLGAGGFGMTYLARDTSLDRHVVIKENLPAQFCFRDPSSLSVAPRHTQGDDVENFRWSLENFSKEAAMLASLDHPGIVKVLRRFEAFGTAYFVMPFVEGVALDELMKQRSGNPFSEEELRGLLERVLAALGYLHERGIYHRDIKPGNILITTEGIPVLIDFGSARQRLSERSMTVVESAGYTPFEQLQSRGNVGPWSDIYAVGATLEKILTGDAPPKAMDRMRGDPRLRLASRPDLTALYNAAFLASIDKALEVEEPQRWQNAIEWLSSLRNLGPALAAIGTGSDEGSVSPIRTSRGAGKTTKANPVPWIIAACVILMLAVWAVTLFKKNPTSVAQAEPSASPTAPSSTPPADPFAPTPEVVPASPSGVAERKPEMVPLTTELPPELIEGLPKPMNVPNLLPASTKAPELLVPAGTVLLSRGKPVTSSDDAPIIGSLDLVTDGDKEAGEGYFMEILDGLQWVQIDLEKSSEISAVWLWHFHSQKRAYNDVIIQISDDPEFRTGVTTIYNNDYDDSARMGKGSDRPYVETRFGMVADAMGAPGRYVRLYSNGNTSNEMSHYIEVEVFGMPSTIQGGTPTNGLKNREIKAQVDAEAAKRKAEALEKQELEVARKAEEQAKRDAERRAPLIEQPSIAESPAEIEIPPTGVIKTRSGLISKILKAGTGTERPREADTVTVHYSGWTTDGKMFDSSVKRGQPASFPLNGVIKGWTEGVQLMVVGEKRRFWIPPDLAYGENPKGGRPGGMLVFEVELLGIKAAPTVPATPEDVAKAPASAERTASGIASRALVKGSGSVHPKAVDQVKVHYSGWTTDGKLFDSSVLRNEPIVFPLNQVIPGWTEGVQLMVEGEKRRLWIPPSLAYGNNPPSGAPAGMLVFDVELIEIVK